MFTINKGIMNNKDVKTLLANGLQDLREKGSDSWFYEACRITFAEYVDGRCFIEMHDLKGNENARWRVRQSARKIYIDLLSEIKQIEMLNSVTDREFKHSEIGFTTWLFSTLPNSFRGQPNGLTMTLREAQDAYINSPDGLHFEYMNRKQ